MVKDKPFIILLFRKNNYKNTWKFKPVSIAFPPVVTADTCNDVEDCILYEIILAVTALVTDTK